MYNEQIKAKFIEYYLSNKDIARTSVENVFKCSEKLELIYDKDICNFAKLEFEEYFKSMNAKSKERISMTNSILKEYKSWSLQAGNCYDDNPYLDSFTVEDFKRFISKNVLENKFIGDETLNSYLEELDNPNDKLLLLLLYNAVRGKQLIEIINLNISQVDGNILHLCTGRDIIVSDEIINLIYETNETYIYYSYGEPRKRWELSGDNVFKTTKGVTSETLASVYHRFSNRMVTFQRMFDNPELALNRIATSGMLNALIKGAKAQKMTLQEFRITESAQKILEQYEFNYHSAKIIKIFEEYLDYIK